MAKLEPHLEATTFPDFIVDEIRQIGINGLYLKGYGSPELTQIESGAIAFEIAKRDASIGNFFIVHNLVGMASIHKFGSQEQKDRILGPAMRLDKILAFGLTEPKVGSDASSLQTEATKCENGYMLNGQKRWIGNALTGDIIIWAKNMADGGRVQPFLVEQGS